MDYNENLCLERHKRVDERLETHDKRLNNHSERLDSIERTSSRLEERLEGLITQLRNLNMIMRWLIGLGVGALVSFFFYAVQSGLFR